MNILNLNIELLLLIIKYYIKKNCYCICENKKVIYNIIYSNKQLYLSYKYIKTHYIKCNLITIQKNKNNYILCNVHHNIEFLKSFLEKINNIKLNKYNCNFIHMDNIIQYENIIKILLKKNKLYIENYCCNGNGIKIYNINNIKQKLLCFPRTLTMFTNI